MIGRCLKRFYSMSVQLKWKETFNYWRSSSFQATREKEKKKKKILFTEYLNLNWILVDLNLNWKHSNWWRSVESSVLTRRRNICSTVGTIGTRTNLSIEREFVHRNASDAVRFLQLWDHLRAFVLDRSNASRRKRSATKSIWEERFVVCRRVATVRATWSNDWHEVWTEPTCWMLTSECKKLIRSVRSFRSTRSSRRDCS